MIEELTLRGFKSYASQQTVRFTAGVNKISGRNASGKTTLLEAILFGLFGEVPGVEKQDLLPMGGGNLHVSLAFRSPHSSRGAKIMREGSLIRSKDRDETFRMTESYLDVDGEDHPYVREKDIQGKMRELLGVGKRVFFNVVYAKQKEFIEILNPPRGRMDAILGLTTPTEVREELREVRRQLEARGRIGERGAVEERIRGAEESIAEAERIRGEVDERRSDLAQRVERLRKEFGDAVGKVDAAELLLSEFRRLERQRTDLEVLMGRREYVGDELAKLYEDVGEEPGIRRGELEARLRATESTEERLRKIVDEELGGERRGLDGQIAKLSHQIEEHVELKKGGIAVCPKCGQRVDHELLEDDLRKWEAELEEDKARLADLERELSLVHEEVRSVQEKRIRIRQELAAFDEQIRRADELRRTIGQLDQEGRRLSERIENESASLMLKAEEELMAPLTSFADGQKVLDERLKRLRAEHSKVQGDLREAEALLREVERQRADLEQRIKAQKETLGSSRTLLDRIIEYEAKIRAVDEVQERYSEYERQLRDNALRQLEYLTYRYFQRLTDQQMYSACHIDREDYALEVVPLGSNRLMPAWRAGGGHESLFALSERLALLRVMGFPHLLILDEPTDAVDSENIPQLLEYIARSSREIGQVLLVTHHGHGEEGGVNLIRVRKVDGESRVTQGQAEG